MKYVFQFLRILIVCFIGEVLSFVLPFPIPASVYGIVVLLLALKIQIIQVDHVKEAGHFFVNILTLLFVPAAVGVMDQWNNLKSIAVISIIAIGPVTIMVMIVSGLVTQWCNKKKKM